MATASAKISLSAPALSVRNLGGPISFGAAGLLIAVGLGMLHWFWIIVGVAVIAYAVYGFAKARKQSREAHADANARIATLREKCITAAAELAEYQSQSAHRSATISTDLDQLRKLLTV